MIVTLRFTLPEEQEELQEALSGGRYRGCLQEMDNYLREKIKYSGESDEVSQRIRDHLISICSDIWEDE